MPKAEPKLRGIELGLSFLAGHLDATGFLIAKGFFVSFMSGNTTQLGVWSYGGFDAIFLPGSLLLSFVAGVTAGAMIAWLRTARERSTLLALSLILLAVAAAAHTLGSTLGFLLPAAFAMGLVNNVFIRDNEEAVGVTYMTGALVRVGQNFAARLLGRKDDIRSGFGQMWLCLAAGAALGGWMHYLPYAAGPVAALVMNAALLMVAWRVERSAGER